MMTVEHCSPVFVAGRFGCLVSSCYDSVVAVLAPIVYFEYGPKLLSHNTTNGGDARAAKASKRSYDINNMRQLMTNVVGWESTDFLPPSPVLADVFLVVVLRLNFGNGVEFWQSGIYSLRGGWFGLSVAQVTKEIFNSTTYRWYTGKPERTLAQAPRARRSLSFS